MIANIAFKVWLVWKIKCDRKKDVVKKYISNLSKTKTSKFDKIVFSILKLIINYLGSSTFL